MDLLRFVIAGSVDDGKSTLVGRLLHDSGSLYEDHIEALAKLAGRAGNAKLDLSLVTDGLKAEREQGVTIDVAYRYFSTARRRFIVIDAPGHEQYTRNMATGASNADLAIVLVDAQLGLLTQTKRHAFICALLGIPRAVIAINKMDLMGHSEARFEAIRSEFDQFAARLGFKSLTFIPVSALNGDNIVHRSQAMPWYDGPSLLEHLETVYVGGDRNLVDLRLPVQRVERAGGERWYAGQVSSGVLKVGDEVVALPSHRRSRVTAIALGERRLQQAFAPMSVAVAIEHDLDVGRGSTFCHPQNAPRGVRELDAMIVWMSDKPLQPGRLYFIKLGTSTVRASCASIDYRIDPDTLHRDRAEALRLNDIGRVRLTLFKECFIDPYARNRRTGAFVVIDADSNLTSAAGMVLDRSTDRPRADNPVPGAHVVPAVGKVSARDRALLTGQRAVTVWLTGLSGAGKSTLAAELERLLVNAGRVCLVLDGDGIRTGLNRDLGFGPEDRRENIRRISEVARLLNEAGVIVVSAFISPYRADREMARRVIGEERFIEVHVAAPLEICEQRDPKGLYRKARRGEIPDFTGITAPYEPPEAATLVVNTSEQSIAECSTALLALVLERAALRT